MRRREDRIPVGETGKKRRSGTKRDYLLWGSVIAAVALILILILPTAYSMYIMYGYNGFKQELAASFSRGEKLGTITVEAGGEERVLEKERAERLFKVIMDAGMGHPRKKIPDSDGLSLEFGDGSSLNIRPTEITEKGRDNDTGVFIRYVRKDGSAFSYDTDELQYETVLITLG